MKIDVSDIWYAGSGDPKCNVFSFYARAIKEFYINKAKEECDAVIQKYARIAAEKIVLLYKGQEGVNEQ